MTTQQQLVQAAARNNAGWCAAMCRSHGLDGKFGVRAWTAPTRTPDFYPDAVTLVPGVTASGVTAAIDATAGATVKDSFADLDLTQAGFQVLFEAQWIHRPAGPPSFPSELSWDVVDDRETLRTWALAWDEGNADLFRPELLDDARTFVLAARSATGHVVAGAVASRSDEALGISNVFASDSGPDAAWPVILEAAHTLFPALPVVGYEQGEDLAAAVRHGFEPVGGLRVWLHGGR
ncbi:hypothetical protein [Streptomyces sp. NPDC046821]|uniref:hypothetical protein n=1 Tax=Streptomyces sp. NPDC046821 TaxID=3154702 RepID=UPI0033D4A489